MLTEIEERAATLAVSRYGADASRVQGAVQAVLQAQAQGKTSSILDLLEAQKLLTSAQAGEIRFAFDKTQIDTSSPRNGAKTADGSTLSPPASEAKASVEAADALGQYRLLRQLGEGGMGAVYLAYQESENRQVAIKILPDHLALNQVSLDRFYREAKSGALLNHPNIVRNITVGRDQATGRHYLVLEYVDGPSAQSLLELYGRLQVGDAVHIVLDIARALEHAHSRNVVHRDIKPANILITQSGVAKLSDLGLAKRTDETSHLTHARQGFGTPYYMPYEQAMNAKHVDGRSDIYALGATLYHLLTGEVPFSGSSQLEIVDKKQIGDFEPASSLNPKVPASLDHVIEIMLAREPKDRYQTASELIVDLERTGTAASVPSFTDPTLAMQDPVMRQRLTTPAQPTSPDLRLTPEMPGNAMPRPTYWYLRYRDRHGQWCKAKATAEQVRQRLRDGKLSADAEGCRKPQGEFLPLNAYVEFQPVLETLAKLKARQSRNGARDSPRSHRRFASLRRWFVIAGLILLGAAVFAIWQLI
jgi:serine/threonine-protein kinase